MHKGVTRIIYIGEIFTYFHSTYIMILQRNMNITINVFVWHKYLRFFFHRNNYQNIFQH